MIAGVSHDLRTALTALISYLEVLEGEGIPAKESPFLGKCKNRALQIKDLINHLFDYFFISTND
ncbi:histidine kinase dimerization/phospho-acceptor domain-containing protein [Desulfitobacterium hafniense]|uniref:histidine kinase dimerization/phospho-acceptor domain-containing protein n=1 Tax=Desulfitobacterium hafniense TaxID=49338 RepID=UPI0003606DC4|nr:histidine kinase dimerization/phospho-acceptor domain-containing protein [Desulfitobacterium hafniense]